MKATIYGKVLDKDGDGLEGAYVSIRNRDNQLNCCNHTTDKGGDFFFILEPGVYLIEVVKDNQLVYWDKI